MRKSYIIEVDCPNCANLCEAEAAKINGVSSATINFMAQKIIIDFADDADEKKVMKSVLKVCKRVEPDFNIEL